MKKIEKDIQNFVNHFTKERIQKLEIDDYVVGKGNNESFCYRLEYELIKAGDIRGSFSHKYGVYYNSKSNTYKYNSCFGGNFEKVKESIIKLIDAVTGKDEFCDVKCDLNGVAKYKIMFLYNPKIMIPCYNYDDLKRFVIDILKINCANYSFETLQRVLVQYKNYEYPKISNIDFMYDLYNKYGHALSKRSVAIDSLEDQKSKLIQRKKNEIIKDKGNEPSSRPPKRYYNGVSYYPRCRETILIALNRAAGVCELNDKHKSFVKKNGETYLEAHHIIPMCCQDDFQYSIDIPANVICLCSECHNKIHYGRDATSLITTIFKKRKAAIKDCGIYISEEKLLGYYKNIKKIEKEL